MYNIHLILLSPSINLLPDHPLTRSLYNCKNKLKKLNWFQVGFE